MGTKLSAHIHRATHTLNTQKLEAELSSSAKERVSMAWRRTKDPSH